MLFLLKVALATGLVVSSFFVDNPAGLPKEYYSLKGKKAKEFFFAFFKRKIIIENKKILLDRKFILSLDNKKDFQETSYEYKRLVSLQKKYKIKELYDYKKYLFRIDIIPPSMALAQAATESGWGRSRFIKVANNIFGHWTYNPNRGIIPRDRPEGKKHLIRVFKSLEDSIAAYMLNLNRTGAYYEFRLERSKMREENSLINGYLLSSTMTKYSGIGHDYVKILRSIISKNNLLQYDEEFHNTYESEKLIKKDTNEVYRTVEI